MSAWLKCFASLAVLVSLVYARPYALSRDMLRGGELFTLSLFGLLGMFVMISGNNLLVIYLGLELLTLSSYALVALRRDKEQATEAAMKYFVLGAMASGFLLYGMSMLYGATGTLDITMIHQAIVAGHIQHQVLVFGLVFIVAGLAFKLGAVPFHMWVPDVYQGAPTGIALMIAGAPKLAAFAIVIRLLVEGLLPLALDWQQFRRDCADQYQTHAGVLHDLASRLYSFGLVIGRGRWQCGGGRQCLQLGHVLCDYLCTHHLGHLRHHHAVVGRRF
jgi:NADH-quinone oxidoreductase subunit N